MNVIIAGEESGTERDAFLALGHNAWSCDMKPTRKPGPHYQGSWRDICWEEFDLALTHPECTHLAVSGSRWFPQKQADGRQQAAIAEFMWLHTEPRRRNKNIRICTENPVCIMSTIYRKPDQVVQPWMFGRWETKALCWWLEGLPKIVVPFKTIDECREHLRLPPGSMPEAKVWKAAPTKDPEIRRQERSASFPEVAHQQALQWGGLVG